MSTTQTVLIVHKTHCSSIGSRNIIYYISTLAIAHFNMHYIDLFFSTMS